MAVQQAHLQHQALLVLGEQVEDHRQRPLHHSPLPQQLPFKQEHQPSRQDAAQLPCSQVQGKTPSSHSRSSTRRKHQLLQ
jgi:hypothetical protein